MLIHWFGTDGNDYNLHSAEIDGETNEVAERMTDEEYQESEYFCPFRLAARGEAADRAEDKRKQAQRLHAGGLVLMELRHMRDLRRVQRDMNGVMIGSLLLLMVLVSVCVSQVRLGHVNQALVQENSDLRQQVAALAAERRAK